MGTSPVHHLHSSPPPPAHHVLTPLHLTLSVHAPTLHSLHYPMHALTLTTSSSYPYPHLTLSPTVYICTLGGDPVDPSRTARRAVAAIARARVLG